MTNDDPNLMERRARVAAVCSERHSGKPVWAIYSGGKYHNGTYDTKREAMAARREQIEWEVERRHEWRTESTPREFRAFLNMLIQVDRVMVLAVPKSMEVKP